MRQEMPTGVGYRDRCHGDLSVTVVTSKDHSANCKHIAYMPREGHLVVVVH